MFRKTFLYLVTVFNVFAWGQSPGAPPGQCLDEDYATVHPYVVYDSIYITYIEDKDAGNWADAEGIRTSNPVRCWVFHKNLTVNLDGLMKRLYNCAKEVG